MPDAYISLNTALSDYYRVRRGRYSDSTWKAHERVLEKWRGWVTRETQPNVPLEVIADPDERYMERYFNKMRPPLSSPRTFNNYRQYCKLFWDYCAAEGWVRVNPMRHVDPLRVTRRVRLQLSAHELIAMLDGAEPRDRIALALGMNTGLRGGDITALLIGSANLTDDRMTAWVEKTDEETVIPITAELRVELLRWFDAYADAMGLASWRELPNDWVLVPPARGLAVNVHDPSQGYRMAYKPTSRYTHPEKIVQRALEKLGHPTKGEGFHTLRRSAARVLFDSAVREGVGDPIRMPQTLLGHKNRATTEIYLGVTHEKRLLDEMLRGKSFLTDAVEAESNVSREADSRGATREDRASA